jgi:uncharacterized phage protein (TIGR02220 family)
MKKTIRNFKGVWIPKNVWLDKDLTLMEKCFLVEVDSLDNENGCFASNAHFSEFFAISKGRCTQILKSLEKKEYIKITLIRNGKQVIKRVIRILNRVVNKLNNPSELIKQPYLENAQGNNTVINNTKDNNTNKEEVISSPIPKVNKRENEITEVLNFVNDNYKKVKRDINSEFNRAKVNTCLNKHSVDDIKRGVLYTISKKVGTNFEEYLRPSTMFALKKMDEYIENAGENKSVIISTDDVENILDIWIALGRTPKTIYQERSPDYLVGLRNRIRDILNEGEKTKEDIVYMIKRAYTFSSHYHKLENILRDVNYMFEQFDRADKQIEMGLRERGKW